MFRIYPIMEKITEVICSENNTFLKTKVVLGIRLWKDCRMLFNECEVIFQGKTIL